MEDLIAIQGKSIAELREIAKVLGITENKLSKKELIARISSIGADNTTAAVSEEPVVATDIVPSAPQKRKRTRLGSVKIEVARKSSTEENTEEVKNETESDVENKTKDVAESSTESTPTAPASSEEVVKETPIQPKKRGRKPKNVTAETTTPVAEDTTSIVEESQEEPAKEEDDKPITKDDFTDTVCRRNIDIEIKIRLKRRAGQDLEAFGAYLLLLRGFRTDSGNLPDGLSLLSTGRILCKVDTNALDALCIQRNGPRDIR